MPECDHTCEVPSWRHVPDTCLRGLRVHRQAGQCCFLTEDTTMNAGDPGDPGSLPGWIRWETLAIKHDLPWPSMTTGDGLWCLYHLQWWWCLYIYIYHLHPPTMVRLGEAWWYLMIFGDWVDQITPQVMAEVLPTVNGKLLMAAALERWTLWNLNAIVITSKNRRTWHDMWIYIYMTIVITIILIMKKKDHQISSNIIESSKYHQWQNVSLQASACRPWAMEAFSTSWQGLVRMWASRCRWESIESTLNTKPAAVVVVCVCPNYWVMFIYV
jgi:hypothetical protein